MQRSTERPLSDGKRSCSSYFLPLLIMGFRFRKSFSLMKGVRINLSKSGLGVSAGVKGARVGVGSKGAYTSVGVPGTGISSLDYIGKGKKQKHTEHASTKAKPNHLLTLLFLGAIVMFFINPVIAWLLFVAWIIAGYFNYKKSKRLASSKEIAEAKIDAPVDSHTSP